MKPKISLIMPVYNAEPFIKKALLSIKAQNFTSLELVIVNDGTPDNSMKIVEEFFLENPMCHIIINQVNQGRTKARNVGLIASQGDYVMFMDSDDFLEPDMINQMYQKIIDEDA